jgi:peptide/nickel transport system permease protein
VPIRYVLKRLGFLVLVMWTAATLNFSLPRMTRRDPITMMITEQVATMGLSPDGQAERIASMKAMFGLDQPLWRQYITYMGKMMQFDLGYSIRNHPRTVNELIAQSIPWTLGLVGTATIIAVTVGTLLGAVLGWGKSPRAVNLLIPPLMVFSATPAFVLALILIYFLAFRAQWFPLGRPYGLFTVVDWTNWRFILEVIYHAALPAFSLVLVSAGAWALGMRAMMVTVEGEDYMTFAEAKGLKSARLFFRYGMRNALLPQVTGLAIQLGGLVAGSTLVEIYFQYPGLGNRLGTAINQFDYNVISGIVFFLVAGIALATFFVDLLYPFLDPRISYQKGT